MSRIASVNEIQCDGTSHPEPLQDRRIALSWTSTAKWLAWVIIVVGFLLRLRLLVSGRSLWVDEAAAGINISLRDFGMLLDPMDYSQTVPLAYVLLTKLAAILVGSGELGLRLAPFVAMFAALILFYLLLRRMMPASEALPGLALFAVLPPLIQYAAEFKPYSIDVMFSVMLLCITLRAMEEGARWYWKLLFGLATALGVWFSLALVFMTAGCGVALIGRAVLSKRNWRDGVQWAIVCAISAMSFALHFWVYLRHMTKNPVLERFWAFYFAPIPPGSFDDIKWYLGRFLQFVEEPGGFTFVGLAAFLAFVGAASLWQTHRWFLAAILMPWVVNILASAVHLYPAGTRVVMYAVPGLLVLVTIGLASIGRWQGQQARLGHLLLLGLLFLKPVEQAVAWVRVPYQKEEIRPVLEEVSKQVQPGDVVYLYNGVTLHWKYYVDTANIVDGFDKAKVVIGVHSSLARTNWSKYKEDLAQLSGQPRVWLVMTHIWEADGGNEERVLCYLLDGMGKRIASVKHPGAVAHLYDLRSPSAVDGSVRPASPEAKP